MAKRRLKGSQRRSLARYVDQLQENLHLAHWNILVVADPPDRDDCYAQITVSRDAHEAVLRVRLKTMRRLDRAGQRQVITHELCHLITDPIDADIGLHAKPAIPGKRYRRIANQTFERAMENAVDDFAWLLAPHQPLPPKGWLDD